MNWWIAAKNLLFGTEGKGVVEQVSDVVDKWSPSKTTIHKQSVEDVKAGDDSQKSAREMQIPTHESWFDKLVDGLSRLVRPLVTYWILGGLIGIYELRSPSTDPMMMNIVWTVITFWFGARMIFKDIPSAIKAFRK
jgi:hypothetical protein